MLERIEKLRQILINEGVDGIIVPSVDEFQSEFCPHHAKRLQWLTGFTGSNGIALILQNKLVFFTDSRYVLQTQSEIDSSFEVHNISQKNIYSWIKENAGDKKIAIHSWLHTNAQVNNLQESCDIKIYENNLIDQIWLDKPLKPTDEIKIYPERFAGESFTSKINKIAQYLQEQNLDAYVISSPESLCWLLNIRANDVPNTPLILSHAILYKNGKIDLFIEKVRIDDNIEQYFAGNVDILEPEKLEQKAKLLTKKMALLDKATAPFALYDLFKDSEIITNDDPCSLPKACKNEVEIEHSRNIHIVDGLAVTRFLFWLDKAMQHDKKISETLIDEVLIELRGQNSNFKNPSFDTIAGFKENGAIVHYRASEQTSKIIHGNGLLLVDSGGQYTGGTTDITRTIAIGEPTQEQKRNFTLVLKGHIALAQITFPKGTTGSQLDVLARQYLWQNGLDYGHGTGHGVGSFLSVHEGPQRISPVPSNIQLEKNMIISNEPGYYKAGEYGIRIENLVLVCEKEEQFSDRKFLYFETISKAPIDVNLIDKSLLNENEINWLNNYHKQIWQDIASELTQDERVWLKQRITV